MNASRLAVDVSFLRRDDFGSVPSAVRLGRVVSINRVTITAGSPALASETSNSPSTSPPSVTGSPRSWHRATSTPRHSARRTTLELVPSAAALIGNRNQPGTLQDRDGCQIVVVGAGPDTTNSWLTTTPANRCSHRIGHQSSAPPRRSQTVPNLDLTVLVRWTIERPPPTHQAAFWSDRVHAESRCPPALTYQLDEEFHTRPGSPRRVVLSPLRRPRTIQKLANLGRQNFLGDSELAADDCSLRHGSSMYRATGARPRCCTDTARHAARCLPARSRPTLSHKSIVDWAQLVDGPPLWFRRGMINSIPLQ